MDIPLTPDFVRAILNAAKANQPARFSLQIGDRVPPPWAGSVRPGATLTVELAMDASFDPDGCKSGKQGYVFPVRLDPAPAGKQEYLLKLFQQLGEGMGGAELLRRRIEFLCDLNLRALVHGASTGERLFSGAPLVPVASGLGLAPTGKRFLGYLMQRGPAERLRDVLARGGLPPSDRLSLARALAQAINLLQFAKIVHGDLCLENILVGPRDHTGQRELVLVDFDLFLSLQEGTLALPGHDVRLGHQIGHYGFMPPPGAYRNRSIDARYDLFALGRLLMYLLCHFRVEGDIDEADQEVLNETIGRNPDGDNLRECCGFHGEVLRPEMQEWFRRSLRRNPAEWPEASVWLNELSHAVYAVCFGPNRSHAEVPCGRSDVLVAFRFLQEQMQSLAPVSAGSVGADVGTCVSRARSSCQKLLGLLTHAGEGLHGVARALQRLETGLAGFHPQRLASLQHDLRHATETLEQFRSRHALMTNTRFCPWCREIVRLNHHTP